MSEIDSLFPVPIYKTFLSEDLSRVKKHIIKLSKKLSLNRNTILNVDTSHNVYDLVNDSFFVPLLNDFLLHSRTFLVALGYDKHFLDKCFVESCWFNISSKTDSLAKHIHPGSIVSGAFYVESSPTDHIYFYRTDDMILPPNNHNKYSTKYVSYPCTPNQLILFKSNLNHSTGAQKEGKKIVISFNIGYKNL
jgi:uncharacterized protein (TIGR02466 family)